MKEDPASRQGIKILWYPSRGVMTRISVPALGKVNRKYIYEMIMNKNNVVIIKLTIYIQGMYRKTIK